LQDILDGIDLGVSECRSIGLLKEDIKPSAISPTLQYSNTMKLINIWSSTLGCLLLVTIP